MNTKVYVFFPRKTYNRLNLRLLKKVKAFLKFLLATSFHCTELMIFFIYIINWIRGTASSEIN